MARLIHSCTFVASLAAVACASSAKPNAASTPNRTHESSPPRIAQPCTLTPVARDLDANSGFPAVYVELAAVALSKESPAPLAGQRPAGFLNTPDLRVLRVGHAMAKEGAAATTPWDDAPSSEPPTVCGKQNRFDLTVTVHRVDLQKRQIELEIAIVPAPPLGTPREAWYVPEHRQLHTTVVVGDQQPLMLGGEVLSHHDTPSLLVATPYLLTVPEHLNELFQCRMATLRTPPRAP